MATRPEITGQIKFRRGFADVLSRHFTIQQGTISLDGSYPPVPFVNLQASVTTADIQAILQLTGPAADPKLTLTSEPPLPQDEILSRLLFGTSAARVTPVQGLRLAAAVQQLQGGGVVSDVLTTLRRTSGLDTLDVQSGATTSESSARAGKYISDKVYVEVRAGRHRRHRQGQGPGRADPQLSVGTSVTEQSQTGVGLQWKYDYSWRCRTRTPPRSRPDPVPALPSDGSDLRHPVRPQPDRALDALHEGGAAVLEGLHPDHPGAGDRPRCCFSRSSRWRCGGAGARIGGVPFAEFLAPGLIMMAMVQNAFANTSSSHHDRQDPGQHRRLR